VKQKIGLEWPYQQSRLCEHSSPIVSTLFPEVKLIKSHQTPPHDIGRMVKAAYVVSKSPYPCHVDCSNCSL